MSVTVRVDGLAALDRALGMLPRATARNVLVRTLKKAGEPIAEDARSNADRSARTGNLRDSIAVSARVKNTVGNAEYAAAMRAGLGKAAAGAALRGARKAAKGTGSFAQAFVGPSRGKGVISYAHIVEFGSVKDAPQPYMRPAWDAKQGQALDIIKAELGNEIIKAARRVGRSKKQSVAAKQSASMAALMAYEAGY